MLTLKDLIDDIAKLTLIKNKALIKKVIMYEGKFIRDQIKSGEFRTIMLKKLGKFTPNTKVIWHINKKREDKSKNEVSKKHKTDI